MPLRERLIARLTAIDIRPQVWVAKVPFVVLIIGALGVGLGLTLWLSTDSAERSYELGSAQERHEALSQQKESLERDVLAAQSAPALAEAARNLGMIPSQDTAHLVQDPAGNWIVVGDPKPAEGTSPPPLNTKLPDPIPLNRNEVSVRVPPAPVALPSPVPGANPEVMVRAPVPALPAPTVTLPAPLLLPSGPAPGPLEAPAPAVEAPPA